MISRQWSPHSTDDHLISRPVRMGPCTGCGRHILYAITYGWDTYVDLDSLPIRAEANALLAGRFTYDLVPKARGRYLIDRDVYRISKREYPILASHACPSGRQPGMESRPPEPEKKPPANPRPKPAPDNSPIPF